MSLTARRLLLLDGAGALVSALALGVWLPPRADWFGAAPWALRGLAAYALGLVIADGVFVFARAQAPRRALRAIALANLGYLVFTAVVLLGDGVALRVWGALYIVAEAAVVAVLVTLETRAASADPHIAQATHDERT